MEAQVEAAANKVRKKGGRRKKCPLQQDLNGPAYGARWQTNLIFCDVQRVTNQNSRVAALLAWNSS
jgi:hypothetical protein